MRILLTNDDGIRAPGIAAMYRALTDSRGIFGGPLQYSISGGAVSGESGILVVAPSSVQSATSHGVTFHVPLMTHEEQVRDDLSGIAVEGRPADCVKLAVSAIWQERFGKSSKPDLAISGMNAGANVGINVIYSGTVAAALEAAFLGIPSIAVSLHLGTGKTLWDLAAQRARRAIELIIAAGLPAPHECLNVNIPLTEEEGPMPPLKVCNMNTHGMIDNYQRRISPAGEVYYWATGQGLDFHVTEEGSDVDELLNRNITVTPLWYDLTNHSVAERWRERLG
jgi:5'-nucleotidase